MTATNAAAPGLRTLDCKRYENIVNLSRDSLNPKGMYLKAVLFVIMLVSCSSLLVLASPTWRTAFLLALVIWSSSRLYYFMFYVIEKYIDPSFRFSGVGAAVSYLMGRRKREPNSGV